MAPQCFAMAAMKALIPLTVMTPVRRGPLELSWVYSYALENSDFFTDEKHDSYSTDLPHICQLLADT